MLTNEKVEELLKMPKRIVVGEDGSAPARFRPFIGKKFGAGEPHIHHYAEGFAGLPWAVPLSADDFPVKGLRDENGVWTAFRAFGAAIGLDAQRPATEPRGHDD